MMTRGNCPTIDELSDFVRGTLRDEDVAGMLQHLEVCSACSRTIVQLEAEPDELTELLRRTQFVQDPQLLDEEPFLNVIDSLSSIEISPVRMSQIPDFTSGLNRKVSAHQVPQPGERIGQYLLLEEIGRGGMGLVYKVLQESLNKIFAMKLLAAGRVNEPRMQERFRREMRAAGKIDHPNVVRASDADAVDGVHFLVMEFVDGMDLSALRKHYKRFSVGHACEIIRQAAVGLAEIHRAGMVHRDMKPGNLMLTRDGQIKILDLGLALLNPQYAMVATNLTSADQLVGTIDYMSPEQAGTTHRVDHRADIFGLGATLFTLLTGRPPLPDGNANLIQKLFALANETAPSVQAFRDDVPDALAAIVARMLHKNPDERISNARNLVDSLQPFCDGTGLADLVPSIPVYRVSDSASEWNPEHDTAFMQGRESSADDFQIEDETNAEDSSHRTSDSESCFETTCSAAASIDQISNSDSTTAPEKERSPSTGSLSSFRLLLIPGVAAIVAGAIWSTQGLSNKTDAESPAASAEIVNDSTTSSSVRIDTPGSVASVPPSDPVIDALKLLAAAPLRDVATVETTLPWEIFSAGVAPDQRTAAIHQAAQIVPAGHLVQRLLEEPSPSIRAGLLLALSESSQSDVLEAAKGVSKSTDLLDTLLHWYVKDPDSEVHACTEFLLRTWGQQQRIEELRPINEQKPMPLTGGWYQPSHVSAMVIVPGPRTELVGSAVNEMDRSNLPDRNEDQRTAEVPYTFAIGLTEVTREQFWRSSDHYWERPRPEAPDLPMSDILWEEAAAFCNRLSLLEGLNEDDLCYVNVATQSRTRWRQKPEALSLSGYRLPTDDEWEIACRAGTATSRPFGNDVTWMERYAICGIGANNPLRVASRKPNALGVFDMLGNVSEWIHTDTDINEIKKGFRRLRGGSAWTEISDVRSAARFMYSFRHRSSKTGFRLARTIVHNSPDVSTSESRGSQIEFAVGPPAPGPGSGRFIAAEYTPLRNEQIVQLGTWDARNLPARSFRLRNNSDEQLRMKELPNLGGVFVFESEPPLEIAAHQSVEFRIRIPSHRVGEHSHDLKFHFEDSDIADVPQIRLHGCIEGPLLEVFTVGRFGTTPETVNLGVVPRGSKSGMRRFMRNIGDTSVEAVVSEVSAPFTVVDPLEGTLVPHLMNKSFRVMLDTEKPGPVEGTIFLRTKQEPPALFSFKVRADVAESTSFSAIGVYRQGTWLIDHNRDAVVDETIEFGTAGDHPLTGDWNGDGTCDVAVWHATDDGRVQVQRRLRGDRANVPLADTEIYLDCPDCIPVAADLDGDGQSEIGYVVKQVPGQSQRWIFDTTHDGTFTHDFLFGPNGSDPVTGDWDGDGIDDVAVSIHGAPAPYGVRLWHAQKPGSRDLKERAYLSHFDIPLAGDWDGDGDDDFGGWRPMPNAPSFWQFETSGDSISDCDLEEFGIEGDQPFVLRSRDRNPQ